MKLSKRIEDLLTLFDDAQKDYEWSFGKVNEMEQATQDYLHKLELEGLNYEERAKVATKLMRCRQDRRKYKDNVMALEPLMEYLGTDIGKKSVKLLREALGKTRKAESKMENRVYFPRVVKEEK